MEQGRGRLAACMAALCVVSGAARADEPAGHDAAKLAALQGLPTHVVLLNERLRSQVAWTYTSAATDAIVQSQIHSLMMNPPPGMSYGSAAAAGALGGLLAGAIVQAAETERAQGEVAPADAVMRDGACMLDDGDALAGAATRAIAGAGLAPADAVGVLRLADGERLAKRLPPRGERHVVTLSYSMSPDYATLLTSAGVATYSDRAGGSARGWEKKPAWSDQLVVASAAIDVPAKTQADIDAGVAAEQARWQSLDKVQALVERANRGDFDARKRIAVPLREHQRNLRVAREPQWSPAAIAQARARVWAADGCARVRAALASNAAELEALLARLHGGSLPPRPAGTGVAAATEALADGRELVAEPTGVYLVRPAGRDVAYAFRYTWLDEPEAAR